MTSLITPRVSKRSVPLASSTVFFFGAIYIFCITVQIDVYLGRGSAFLKIIGRVGASALGQSSGSALWGLSNSFYGQRRGFVRMGLTPSSIFLGRLAASTSTTVFEESGTGWEPATTVHHLFLFDLFSLFRFFFLSGISLKERPSATCGNWALVAEKPIWACGLILLLSRIPICSSDSFTD